MNEQKHRHEKQHTCTPRRDEQNMTLTNSGNDNHNAGNSQTHSALKSMGVMLRSAFSRLLSPGRESDAQEEGNGIEGADLMLKRKKNVTDDNYTPRRLQSRDFSNVNLGQPLNVDAIGSLITTSQRKRGRRLSENVEKTPCDSDDAPPSARRRNGRDCELSHTSPTVNLSARIDAEMDASVETFKIASNTEATPSDSSLLLSPPVKNNGDAQNNAPTSPSSTIFSPMFRFIGNSLGMIRDLDGAENVTDEPEEFSKCDDSYHNNKTSQKKDINDQSNEVCDGDGENERVHAVPEQRAAEENTLATTSGQYSGRWENDVSELDDLYLETLLFIHRLPPLHLYVDPSRKCILPRKTRRCPINTLVLDLDETLVHSSLEGGSNVAFEFFVDFNNQKHSVKVRCRPNLTHFMEYVSQLFEVVVFTASQKIYAESLLNILDPNRAYIRHRVYRDSCVVVDGNFLKDLTVLGRDIRRTIIIDNSPQAFGFQLDNGVPIESWFDDENDIELLELLPFLEGLADVEDVRPYIREKFRLQEKADWIGERFN